jgi:hypothetical protein
MPVEELSGPEREILRLGAQENHTQGTHHISAFGAFIANQGFSFSHSINASIHLFSRYF